VCGSLRLSHSAGSLARSINQSSESLVILPQGTGPFPPIHSDILRIRSAVHERRVYCTHSTGSSSIVLSSYATGYDRAYLYHPPQAFVDGNLSRDRDTQLVEHSSPIGLMPLLGELSAMLR
jgi:hypothetical protein